MILLDSDHLSVLLDMRDARSLSLEKRLADVGDGLALPIVSVEEHMRGWLALIHRKRDPHEQIIPYRHLKRTFEYLRQWPIAEWSDLAADRFVQFRSSRIRIGTQDLKIACIALACDALLFSANLRDFKQVPGLRVEAWL